MLGIGINEGVYLLKADLSPKGALEITFGELSGVESKKLSAFDILNADTVIEKEVDRAIRIFPPMPPKEGNDRTEEKNQEMIIGDINGTKAVLVHLLKGYLPSDAIVGKISPFVGLPIDGNNFTQQLFKKDILEAIHKNMCTQFIQLISPFLNRPDLSFRLLLVRQSTDKNFPTFRKKYLDENPIYESSDITRSDDPAKNQSKVAFTQYEIDNGLNSAAAVSKDSKSTGTPGPQDAPKSVKNVFGLG